MDVKQFSADKIFAHIDRIDEWLQKGVSRPVTFEMDMTNVCNHRCPWCIGFFNRGQKNCSIALDEAKDILRQIKGIGGRGVTFTGGGDPLCNPATPAAVEYARKIGLDVGFITNGYALDKKSAKILVKNCLWIRISLDADSPGIFKISHGMGKSVFERVLENIRMLAGMKKHNKNCVIGIGYLTSSETEKGIHNFALLGRRLGVDYVQYRPLLEAFCKNSVDYYAKNQKSIIREIEKCSSLSQASFDVLYSKHKYETIDSGKIPREYDVCYGHNFAAVIAADKKMYLCCQFRGIKKYCIGDLNKMSLKDIWRSKKRKQVYAKIRLKECPPLCRCNTFNTILWNIKQKKEHENFL